MPMQEPEETIETPQMTALQEVADAADAASTAALEMLSALDDDPTQPIAGALDQIVLALERARLAVQRAGAA